MIIADTATKAELRAALEDTASIADKVGQLTVFQRRPNWCAPLHNAPISAAEMASIRADYAAIFKKCDNTPGGFIHGPDRRRPGRHRHDHVPHVAGAGRRIGQIRAHELAVRALLHPLLHGVAPRRRR